MTAITWTNERRTLRDLTPWERNPRQIADAQAERLLESFNEFGQVLPICISPAGAIYDGHQRKSVIGAASEYGLDYEVDVRVSSRELTERERQKLTVYLHRGATGDWEWQALAEWEYEDLTAWGFDSDELDERFGIEDGSEGAGEDTEPQIDKAAELLAKWGVKTGDLWQLGDHRLICGDCTDAEVVGRLMDGERAALCLTDPPYGIERDKGFEGFEGFGPPIARRQYTDDWDSDRPDSDAFDLIIDGCDKAIIFGGNFFADILPRSTHWIVWDKLNTMPTFGDCELAWTNANRTSVKKYTVQYNGLIGKEKERFHPTQKPVALMQAVLADYGAKGDLVYEPFAGSGTTIIAAHNLSRKCRAIEISPAYVAVCLQRFLDHTGITPERIDS